MVCSFCSVLLVLPVKEVSEPEIEGLVKITAVEGIETECCEVLPE